MSIGNLGQWSYWFGQPFTARGVAFAALVGVFLGMALAGIIIRFYANIKLFGIIKAAWFKFSNLGMTMGLLGLVWLFFRQQRVVFLAWRFWLLLWLIIFVWWLYSCLYYLIKRLPQIKEEKIKRELKDKYLPRK